ncbi:hypothetical protein D3C87_2110620 [compost metagenome]
MIDTLNQLFQDSMLVRFGLRLKLVIERAARQVSQLQNGGQGKPVLERRHDQGFLG